MRVTSLFSGAGGLDVGLEQAGHELLLLCDSDPGARQVLKNKFPGVRIHDDVVSLEKVPEETELLVAGFPCIDVSRAGLRRGLDGQSTGLVRHVFRLLQKAKDDHRPVPWVLLENVEALLDRHAGEPPVMQYCAQKFIELGYQSWAYRVVNSAGFGLPNRRRRVFMVASLHGDARDVLLSQGAQRCTGGCQQLFDGAKCFLCHTAQLRDLEHHSRVSYALDMGNAMSPAGEDIVPTFTTSNERMLLLLSNGAHGMLRVEDAERLQGLEEGHTRACWPIQTPGVGAHRAARRDSDADACASKRWDLLGNAVTVPVAKWLGERLKNPYQFKYHGISTSDRPMENLLTEGAAADSAATMRPKPMHPWSYVATDQLQDALVFPYLSITQRRKEAARQRRRLKQLAQATGKSSGAGSGGVSAALSQDVDGDSTSEDSGSDSGGNLPHDSDGELQGMDAEAAEMIAVARAARKRTQQADGQPVQQPCTPCETTPLPVPSIHAAVGGSSSEDNVKDAAGSADTDGGSQAAGAAGNEQEAEADARLARAAGKEEEKQLFQAAIVQKKHRGQVQQAARQQSGWDRHAWPRAAWWVRGLGSFGLEEMSECPIPAPFVPLGDFVQTVGREATQEEIHTYLHRMRVRLLLSGPASVRPILFEQPPEKGWDVGKTIEKLLQNGTRISSEAHQIVRIPGLLTDADMIGDLVWAFDKTANCWWPGEKLDPLDMPAGRDLPLGAIRELSADEKLASLPRYQALAAKLTAEQRTESRRVLVCFLPISNGTWQWYRPSELESFEENSVREREAEALIKSSGGRWKYGEEMLRAMKDAKASLYIKHNRNCLEADQMRRTRASAAAAAINLKQRCGQCKTCMNNNGQRRFDCLTQRLRAAALSGHAGAQIAVNGDGAIGARVQVWWAGDQCFYAGMIAYYDPVSTEHTVCYDDGEVGMHRLWQHDERIRLASAVEQWPRDAALARHRLAVAQEKLRAREQGRRARVGAAVAVVEEEKKTPYVISTDELRRRNRKVFELMFTSNAEGEENDVVAAAQQAARAAANQAGQLTNPASASLEAGNHDRGEAGYKRPGMAMDLSVDGAGSSGTMFAPPSKRRSMERCGACKACMNPKLKKACQVVRMAR